MNSQNLSERIFKGRDSNIDPLIIYSDKKPKFKSPEKHIFCKQYRSVLDKIGFNLRGNFVIKDVLVFDYFTNPPAGWETTFKNKTGIKCYTEWHTTKWDERLKEIKIGKKIFYDNTSIFNNSILLTALFPDSKKNIPHKRFKNINPIFYTKEDAIKAHKIDKISLSLSRKKYTDCIFLEIDNKTLTTKSSIIEKAITLDILNHFKTIPVLHEIRNNGGTHIHYLLDKEIDYETLKPFIDSLNKKHENNLGVKVEITSTLRLPFNKYYKVCKIKSLKKHIYNIKNDLPLEYYTSIQEGMDDILKFDKRVPVDLIIKGPIKANQELIKIIPYYRENPVQSNYENLLRRYHSICTSNGDRVKPMYAKASLGTYLGFSDNKIAGDILTSDKGSKDLKVWSNEKLLKEVAMITSKKNNTRVLPVRQGEGRDSKDINFFISNSDKVPLNIKSYIHSRPYVDLISKKLNYIRNSKKEELYKLITLISMEIIGKIIFEETTDNKRKVIDVNELNSLRYNMLIGYQFPQIYLLRIKTYLEKKHDIKIKDIYRIFKAIITNTDLFTQYIYTKKGYSFYGYVHCKQWVLKKRNYDTIYDNLKLLFKELIYKYNYYYKSIINIFNIKYNYSFFTEPNMLENRETYHWKLIQIDPSPG